MPFTEEFQKLRRRFWNQYEDRAKAETFAFQEALLNKIPTYEDRKRFFKRVK